MKRPSLRRASRSTHNGLLIVLSLCRLAQADQRAPVHGDDKPAAITPAPSSPAVDPCAQPGPILPDNPLPSKLSLERRAIRDWEATYTQCPTPENLYRIAGAYEVVGRKERSVVHLEQALSLYEKYLRSQPSPERAAEVQRRIGELHGLVASRRAGPMLEEARKDVDSEDAIGHYDRYLRATPDSPDHAEVQAERDRRLGEAESQWRRRERGRQAVGVVIALVGVGAAAGGAALVMSSRSHATSAMQAATLGEHDDQLSTATVQRVGGIALVGAGGALLVAGVVRLATGRRPEPRHALWFAPTTNGLLAGGTF